MTSVNKNRKSRDENAMAKYNEKELADTSKFLSFVLRHKPEAIGIVLDREGWADIDKLILCAQKAGKRLTRALLDTVVATSDKKRFSYSSDGRCIRAVQGHSTSQVAISFAEKTPPQFLYHGTASRFLDEIKKQGLIAGDRHSCISLLMKQRHAKCEQDTDRRLS